MLDNYFRLLELMEEEHGKLGVATGVVGSLVLLGISIGLIWLGITVGIFALEQLFF